MKRVQKVSRKKHANRPRPLVTVPLSDDERRTFAAQEWRKAHLHLSEAEVLAAAGTTPNACVHSAYYAMYHGAAASILSAGGVGKRKDVPASHAHVIEHFAKLAQTMDESIQEAAAMLSRARTDRNVADYGLDHHVTPEMAAKRAADARRFIEVCRTNWKFD